MKITTIHYNENFKKQFQKLPKKIQQKAIKMEKTFRKNPFHPSLRLHKLQGKLKELWSISISHHYRIIFKPIKNDNILFISIGLHAIYNQK